MYVVSSISREYRVTSMASWVFILMNFSVGDFSVTFLFFLFSTNIVYFIREVIGPSLHLIAELAIEAVVQLSL